MVPSWHRRVWLNCIPFLLLGLSVGCNTAGEDSSNESGSTESSSTSDVSDVPLRLLFVGELSDPSMVKRQWAAGSDQPIEISTMPLEDYLAADNVPCDVVCLPAQLLGESIHRKWIVPLPPTVQQQPDGLDEEAWVADSEIGKTQAIWGGVSYGISLAETIPVVIASETFEKAESPRSWNAVIEQVSRGDEAFDLSSVNVDKDAVVDRFLAVVSTITKRSPRYGMLFEMQTMKCRLQDDEFVEALETLSALMQQPGGATGVLASHQDAWDWVVNSSDSVVAIASPMMIRGEAAEATNGQILDLKQDNQLAGWNTGHGLIAALSAECRQTSRAIGMLRWMKLKQTRNQLATLMVGVASVAPQSGLDSLQWRARQEVVARVRDGVVPHEPSLPLASSYRDVLGEQLVEVLTGKTSAKAGLEEAFRAWQKMTLSAGAEHRTNYEKSLGLIL